MSNIATTGMSKDSEFTSIKLSGNFTNNQAAPTALTAANAITAANIMGRLITCATAVTHTLPTAASMVAAFVAPRVNDSVDFWVINTSGGTVTIAVGDATAPTIVGTATILTTISSQWRVRLTAVASGAETYTVYRIA